MKRESGFTLIELLVVVAILGVLGATAMPLYNTWQQRAYGSEAILMMKTITEGEILYMLENDQYFPGPNESLMVNKDGTGIPNDALAQINEALNLAISVNGRLEYQISNNGDGSVTITIQASFPLFKNGLPYVMALLNEDGRVEYMSFESFG